MTKETGVQVDLCGHSSSEDKPGPDKDNSMEAILLTTQLKEEVLLSGFLKLFRCNLLS